MKLKNLQKKNLSNLPLHHPLKKSILCTIKEKEDYLKASLQINAVDLDSAAEKAKIDNQKLYQEIVNPTPGLVVDNKLDLDQQFDSTEVIDETN